MSKGSVPSTQLKDEMAKEIGVYEVVRQNDAEGKKHPNSEKEQRTNKMRQPKNTIR